jgi:hypothetical protein
MVPLLNDDYNVYNSGDGYALKIKKIVLEPEIADLIQNKLPKRSLKNFYKHLISFYNHNDKKSFYRYNRKKLCSEHINKSPKYKMMNYDYYEYIKLNHYYDNNGCMHYTSYNEDENNDNSIDVTVNRNLLFEIYAELYLYIVDVVNNGVTFDSMVKRIDKDGNCYDICSTIRNEDLDILLMKYYMTLKESVFEKDDTLKISTMKIKRGFLAWVFNFKDDPYYIKPMEIIDFLNSYSCNNCLYKIENFCNKNLICNNYKNAE